MRVISTESESSDSIVWRTGRSSGRGGRSSGRAGVRVDRSSPSPVSSREARVRSADSQPLRPEPEPFWGAAGAPPRGGAAGAAPFWLGDAPLRPPGAAFAPADAPPRLAGTEL